MLCQNCKINDSTIHLYTNLNGKQKQIDLCQNCYKIIKTDPNNSLFKGMTDLNNRDFDPFGDFFNDLNNFRPSSNTPPIPPNPISGGTVETAVMAPKIVDLLKLLHLAKKKAYQKNLVSM